MRTRLTELLGVETPVMLAGMGGIAGLDLVAAVSNAGGFGTWGSAIDVVNHDPDFLRQQMQVLKTMCNGRPFGVDLLVHGHDGGMMKVLVDIICEGGAKAFISGRGHLNKELIEVFRSRGVLVGAIGGKVQHCISAVDAGVDFVIAQGTEGGGHTGDVPLAELLPAVVKACSHRVPVVAAGGLHRGKDLADCLARGADGVWVGTRFLMTEESHAHPCFKQKLVEARPGATRITRALSGSPMRALVVPYVEEYEATPIAKRKKGAAQLVKSTREGVWRHYHIDAMQATESGEYLVDFDIDNQAYPAGEVCGEIDSIDRAGDVVRRITAEAVGIQSGARSKL